MGISTAPIGFVPNYAPIGLEAAILLFALRLRAVHRALGEQKSPACGRGE